MYQLYLDSFELFLYIYLFQFLLWTLSWAVVMLSQLHPHNAHVSACTLCLVGVLRSLLCGLWRGRWNLHVSILGRHKHRSNNSSKNTQPAGNSTSTIFNENPPWYMDTGSTDHLTSDLERLHVHERYGGKDQVHVANGTGLSISHIGHSNLTGSSLKLSDILHVLHIRKHLLFVYRLVSNNDVFVEFHRHFSVLRTRTLSEFCFMVGVREDSTPSHLLVRLHHHLDMLRLVSGSLPHSGISVLAILPIM